MSSTSDLRPTAVELPARTAVPWVAVGMFVAVAFGLAWAVVLPLWIGGGLRDPAAGILLPVMMFTPAVAAVAVVLFVQRPRPRSLWISLGVVPLRPARRILALGLIGLFGSVLISGLSVLLAAATGTIRLDLTHFSGFEHLLHEKLAAAGVSSLPVPVGILVAAQLATIPVGAVVNSVLTVGEELGWRGWLLPALRPLGTWPALLASGAIWGLWHAPIILLGYDFDEPNPLGVVFMTLGCTSYGVLLGWLRLRSGSIWPSVIAHGAFNASAGVGVLLLAADSPHSPLSLLPLGWPGWVTCAAFAVVLTVTGQMAKQRPLATQLTGTAATAREGTRRRM
jgi:membrane protease YdiL (CAAX protease family)